MGTATPPNPAPMKRLWTFDKRVAELPESNLPMELWAGEIIVPPVPTPAHQQAVANFAMRLDDYVKSFQAGEVFISVLDVILTQRDVVQPDVFFIAQSRLDLVTDRVRCAPDLAAEVVSEESFKRDRVDKRQLYEKFGVREYWIVDPEAQTVEVFALENGGFKLHAKAGSGETAVSKLLPGFQVAWSQLIL